MSVPRDALFITLAAGVGIAGAVAFSTMNSGVAETPAVFAEVEGLTQALSASGETGKPAVVLVTADWCPPCQKLKKDTLVDERVTTWLDENAVAVTLVDGQNNDDIARLPMRAFPTTFVIRGETIVGQLEGYRGPEGYLSFLEGAVESPAEPG